MAERNSGRLLTKKNLGLRLFIVETKEPSAFQPKKESMGTATLARLQDVVVFTLLRDESRRRRSLNTILAVKENVEKITIRAGTIGFKILAVVEEGI